MHADFLFIIAEIGAAFAGFASLVAAISRRGDRSADQERLDFGTLQNVLLLSLQAIAFALLPNLLERLTGSESTAWRVAATCYAPVIAGYVAYTLGRLPRTYGHVGRQVPATFWLNAALIIATVVIQVLVATASVPAVAYLAGISVLLYCAGFGFVRLFVSLRPTPREAA